MEIANDYLAKFKKTKRGPNSERAELIGRIEKFTNASCIKAGYRPYSDSYIGYAVCHLSTADLRDHVVQSEKAPIPSKYFWGKLKIYGTTKHN